MQPDAPYDALLIISYGGPEGPEEVRPFLENVLHGKNVTQEQLGAVAAKYHAIGGGSPVNEECRSLISGLLQRVDEDVFCFKDKGTGERVDEVFRAVEQLPIYWGNLFWHPMLEDTIAGMAEDGIRRVIAFCTVPFGTEHSTRSYSGAIDAAVKKANIPDFVVQQTRLFSNHPLFLSAMADRLAETLRGRGLCEEAMPSPIPHLSPLPSHPSLLILFTAHSVPVTDNQIESHQSQLRQACSLVADLLQLDHFGIEWDIAYQSRSKTHVSWCGPDVSEFVKTMPERFPDKKAVIACPIGFMLENMELLYDLDVELRQLCESLGLEYDRTLSVSGHRKIIAMIRELVAEVYSPLVPRRFLG